jgi:hypothetical protein
MHKTFLYANHKMTKKSKYFFKKVETSPTTKKNTNN